MRLGFMLLLLSDARDHNSGGACLSPCDQLLELQGRPFVYTRIDPPSQSDWFCDSLQQSSEPISHLQWNQ